MRSAGTDHAGTFVEKQRFRQVWLWALLILAMVGSLAPAVFTAFANLSGSAPGPARDADLGALAVSLLALLLMLGIFWLFYAAELTVKVADDALHIRFYPFLTRKIPYTEIVSAESRQYRPLIEYGGWGLRGFGSNRALNVYGNWGVQLVLQNGDRLLLGSQRSEVLAEAINIKRQGRRA